MAAKVLPPRMSMDCAVLERRKRERVDLRCSVQVFAAPERRAFEASTLNLSSDGVYWLSSVAFSPGERIQCSIFITTPGFRAAKTPLCLHCRVRVVRVEEREAGFGLGCRIEEFALLPDYRASASAADLSRVDGLAAVPAV